MCWWLGLIATGVSAAGQVQEGKEGKAAAFREAGYLEEQARDVLSIGSSQEGRFRQEVAKIAGMQRSQIGTRNVAKSGTALDILRETKQFSDEEAQAIINDAAREAHGLRTQARHTRAAGRSLQRNSYYSAGASLISGGAQAYGQWYGGRGSSPSAVPTYSKNPKPLKWGRGPQ
jgi:hypothetical protein